MSYDQNNIFAKILRGEIPNKTVYEDEHVLAFHDIAGAAPIHVLVIPKGDYISFHDFSQAAPEVIAAFFASVRKVVDSLNIAEDGYRLITNHCYNGSQSVEHFHVHILGGVQLGGLIASDTLVR